jgi:hypothetical protein
MDKLLLGVASFFYGQGEKHDNNATQTLFLPGEMPQDR